MHPPQGESLALPASSLKPIPAKDCYIHVNYLDKLFKQKLSLYLIVVTIVFFIIEGYVLAFQDAFDSIFPRKRTVAARILYAVLFTILAIGVIIFLIYVWP